MERPPTRERRGRGAGTGGKRLRIIGRPVRTGEAQALYEETTGNLWLGDCSPSWRDEPVTRDRSMREASRDVGANASAPYRADHPRLAALDPATLA